MMSGNRDDTFSKIGYSNLKKTLVKKHKNAALHRECVEMLVAMPHTTS